MSEKKPSLNSDAMQEAAAETVKATAPTAASLQNPYRRIFTKTPDFATLARCAYDAEKAGAAPDNKKDEKNAPMNG